jgi:hypothetical protein
LRGTSDSVKTKRVPVLGAQGMGHRAQGKKEKTYTEFHRGAQRYTEKKVESTGLLQIYSPGKLRDNILKYNWLNFPSF